MSSDQYEVFEQMHYVCFYYEFEHDPADPDEECSAGDCPSKTVRPRPMRRPENVAAAADLARRLTDRLTPQQQLWGAEYLQAQEWGLALEMFADWLSEEGLFVSKDERDIFERLSTQIGNAPRVMGPLALCPEHP